MPSTHGAAGDFADTRISPIHLVTVVAHDDDTDALGHISNLTHVRWIQDAAAAHSAAVGWDLARYQAEGLAWVVRRHEITYLAQVFSGDALTLRTWVAGWKGASSPRRTSIVRDHDDVEVGRAETLWALIDLASGRPRRLPASMKQDFEQDPASTSVLPR